ARGGWGGGWGGGIWGAGGGGVVEPALPEARTASALRDLEGGAAGRQRSGFGRRPRRVSRRVDQLDEVAAAERGRGHAFEKPGGSVDAKAHARPVKIDDVVGTRLKRVVDLSTQLVAHDEEDDEGGSDNCQRNSRCGDESQARPETEVLEVHGSRSAYPTPRTVWIRRGLPPVSVFRRR